MREATSSAASRALLLTVSTTGAAGLLTGSTTGARSSSRRAETGDRGQAAGSVRTRPSRLRHAPAVYSGFAAGMGIERQAILKRAIDDIRYFYDNDIRFLERVA